MITINREKAKQTSLERYGVDHPLKSDYAKQRKVEAVIEKYGVDTVWKLPAIQKKVRETILERYGVDDPLKLVDWSKINVTKGHQQIIDFVKEFDVEIKVNDRTLISPRELDIYLPEYKLAIEYNGLFWHSESAGKDAKYHLTKTKEVEAAGCKLIHIFEDELRDKPEIVKSRLRHLLGKSKRIYARQCKIIDLNSKDAESFLDRCHIQGRVRSKVRYGLSYHDELVAVMTFGSTRFTNKYDWELLRYASELNCHVIGGASKLLTHFRKNHQGTIVTYADR